MPVNDNIYVLIGISIGGGILLTGGVLYFTLAYARKIRRQKEELRQVELAYRSRLFAAVLESQEEERRKIGRDLHDEVGSILSAVRLSLSSSAMRAGDDPKANEDIRAIDKLSGIVRNISHLLSPPDLEYAGFHDALETLCDSFASDGLEIVIRDEARETIPIERFSTALSLYRIFQELLTNTVRHAQATQIGISLHAEDNRVVIAYSDNGKGYDPAVHAAGLGMQNIQSRILMLEADHTLDSAPGRGFRLTLYLGREQARND
jgi:signal transduction histidine kinase